MLNVKWKRIYIDIVLSILFFVILCLMGPNILSDAQNLMFFASLTGLFMIAIYRLLRFRICTIEGQYITFKSFFGLKKVYNLSEISAIEQQVTTDMFAATFYGIKYQFGANESAAAKYEKDMFNVWIGAKCYVIDGVYVELREGALFYRLANFAQYQPSKTTRSLNSRLDFTYLILLLLIGLGLALMGIVYMKATDEASGIVWKNGIIKSISPENKRYSDHLGTFKNQVIEVYLKDHLATKFIVAGHDVFRFGDSVRKLAPGSNVEIAVSEFVWRTRVLKQGQRLEDKYILQNDPVEIYGIAKDDDFYLPQYMHYIEKREMETTESIAYVFLAAIIFLIGAAFMMNKHPLQSKET